METRHRVEKMTNVVRGSDGITNKLEVIASKLNLSLFFSAMNLSKSVKTRENLSQFDQKEKDFRSKTEAWSGSSSPI